MHGSMRRSGYPSDSSRCCRTWGVLTVPAGLRRRRRSSRPHRSESGRPRRPTRSGDPHGPRVAGYNTARFGRLPHCVGLGPTATFGLGTGCPWLQSCGPSPTAPIGVRGSRPPPRAADRRPTAILGSGTGCPSPLAYGPSPIASYGVRGLRPPPRAADRRPTDSAARYRTAADWLGATRTAS